MKNLYHRKAGKVHPSSASASAANSCRGDAYSVLRLLPVAIATLKATLPPEDQEVLAYLIARSPDVLPLQETETKKNRSGAKNGKLLPSSAGIDSEQEDQETPALGGGGGGGTGTASLSSPSPFRSSSSPFARFAEADAQLRRNPSGRAGGLVLKEDLKNKRKASQNSLREHRLSFDCGCFQCYMGFWRRWDASPNREIIHKAIDCLKTIWLPVRPQRRWRPHPPPKEAPARERTAKVPNPARRKRTLIAAKLLTLHGPAVLKQQVCKRMLKVSLPVKTWMQQRIKKPKVRGAFECGPSTRIPLNRSRLFHSHSKKTTVKSDKLSSSKSRRRE